MGIVTTRIYIVFFIILFCFAPSSGLRVPENRSKEAFTKPLLSRDSNEKISPIDWDNVPEVSVTGKLHVIAIDYTGRAPEYVAALLVNEETSRDWYNIDIGALISSPGKHLDISPLLETESVVSRFLHITDAYLSISGKLHESSIRLSSDDSQSIRLVDDSQVYYNLPESADTLSEQLTKHKVAEISVARCVPKKISLGETMLSPKVTLPLDIPLPPKAPVSGERPTLMLISTWNDHPSFSPACTVNSVTGWMWTDDKSVDGIFKVSSRGNYKLTGEAEVHYIDMNQNMPNYNDANPSQWMDDTSIAVEGAHGCSGNACNQFLTRGHIVPQSMPAGWAGIAYVTNGKVSTTAFSKACDEADVMAHEIGHNIGHAHSGTPSTTYGDVGSIMGYGAVGIRLFNGPKQLTSGWITEDPTSGGGKSDLPPQYNNNPSDGCAVLAPRYLDETMQPCAGSYLIKHNGYYFEFAPKGGMDDSISTPEKVVRVLDWNGNQNSPTEYLGYLEEGDDYAGFFFLKAEDTHATASIGSKDEDCKDYKIEADCSKPGKAPPPDITATVLGILIPLFIIGGLGAASVMYKRKNGEWPHEALQRKLQSDQQANSNNDMNTRLTDAENPVSPRGNYVAGASAAVIASPRGNRRPQPNPRSAPKSRPAPPRPSPSRSVAAAGASRSNRPKPKTGRVAPKKPKRSAPPPGTKLDRGQLVSAKWDDGKFYKAKVLLMIGSNKVKVRFVQYDETATIPLSNIRL